MRAIKVYCPPGVEPPLYAFIDALDGKLKAIRKRLTARAGRKITCARVYAYDSGKYAGCAKQGEWPLCTTA